MCAEPSVQDKYTIACPSCWEEEIVIDLTEDADYECTACGFVFAIEVSLTPFAQHLFELTPLSTVH